MPIYEYRCTTCATGFEELVFGDTAVACPSCRSSAVARRLSVPARPATATARAAPSCDEGLPASECCGGGACHPN